MRVAIQRLHTGLPVIELCDECGPVRPCVIVQGTCDFNERFRHPRPTPEPPPFARLPLPMMDRQVPKTIGAGRNMSEATRHIKRLGANGQFRPAKQTRSANSSLIHAPYDGVHGS